MNNQFFPLSLLVNTSTYYGPLDYTVKLTNKNLTLDSTFYLTFNLFSDPIPNTIDQVVCKWPGIKEQVGKLDIYDEVTFTTSIGCWTVKDGHLLTFGQERFRKTFQDTHIVSVRELKQEYNIVDEREGKVKTCVENLFKQIEKSPSQEYLIVELINKDLGLDLVSNYSIGYKCLFKDIKLGFDLQTIKIHYIITDYYNLARTSTDDLGSEHVFQIKLPSTLPNDIDELLTHSSDICVKVPGLNSENFSKYLQLVDKLKNWSKYNQVDMFARELLVSKPNYVEYVNKILGCETKINNSALNIEYIEQVVIPDGSMSQFNNLQAYDPNEPLGESFY